MAYQLKAKSIVTAVAQVPAVVQVQSLAQELLHVTGTDQKKKKKKIVSRYFLRFVFLRS